MTNENELLAGESCLGRVNHCVYVCEDCPLAAQRGEVKRTAGCCASRDAEFRIGVLAQRALRASSPASTQVGG